MNMKYIMSIILLVNFSCVNNKTQDINKTKESNSIEDINKIQLFFSETIFAGGGSYYYNIKNDTLTVKHDYFDYCDDCLEKDTTFSIKLTKYEKDQINKILILLMNLDNEYVNSDVIDGFVITLEIKNENETIKKIIIQNTNTPEIVDSLMGIFYLEFPFPMCRNGDI